MSVKIKSRLGTRPIKFGNLKVENKNNLVTISNGKESLSTKIDSAFCIEIINDVIAIKLIDESKFDKQIRALWGTYSRLLQNNILGLQKPHTKEIKCVVIGYRAAYNNNVLELKIGYCHPVQITVPENITLSLRGTSIFLSSYDKIALGTFAQTILSKKKYNVYTQKGILLQGKTYVTKEIKKKK